ncbi:vWA domain-containing protein [Verrucosispora sp. WMMC514]|uniref:vWA domain-containing protein n=1 Tax=Verrucosispora sp. WMMC514 TaxID=3015156 RepID=UPI00248B7ED5|nr:vWA domain-containing protein [Verrucosispora sp. WMMC514]WBB94236.1 VWA domain-containing protein [Verrucosispora sp. WMMC514]
MSKPVTFVLLITDESGSMYGLADDVRGGFNAYVEGLRADTERDYRLTVALFNHTYRLLCNAASLTDVPALDRVNYRPGGNTALLDAVGKTVADFEQATVLADDARVLVVVQTDGAENASREYTRDGIAALIREREATARWSFVFLGAGPDTWRQARGMGFDAATTVAMASTGDATQSSYAGLATATRSYSRGGSGADTAATIATSTGGRTVAASPNSDDTN